MGEPETVTRERPCEAARKLVDDFLAGRLDAEADVAFEAHLLVCDACFTAYLVRTVDDL